MVKIKRVLGLDVGDKWIGVAISDSLGLIAQTLKTIKRETSKQTLEEISEIISEYEIEKVVVGLPKNMNNTIGPQGEKTMKFASRLSRKYEIEIIYIDERMSSISAERVLIEADVRRENRKKYIDQIAATYILQTYLDGLKEK